MSWIRANLSVIKEIEKMIDIIKVFWLDENFDNGQSIMRYDDKLKCEYCHKSGSYFMLSNPKKENGSCWYCLKTSMADHNTSIKKLQVWTYKSWETREVLKLDRVFQPGFCEAVQPWKLLEKSE